MFVGQRKDPFVVNLGEVFDLVNLNPLGARDAGEHDDLDDKNVTALVLEVPIALPHARERSRHRRLDHAPACARRACSNPRRPAGREQQGPRSRAARGRRCRGSACRS